MPVDKIVNMADIAKREGDALVYAIDDVIE